METAYFGRLILTSSRFVRNRIVRIVRLDEDPHLLVDGHAERSLSLTTRANWH